MTTPEALAYEQSVRAIDHQVRMLAELRSRTGILLAGASIVASFLGGQALARSELGALGLLAIVAFLAVIALCLWVLMPRRDWGWNVSAKTLLEDWADVEDRRDDVAALQRFLAEALEGRWDENQAALHEMQDRFRYAVFALGAEVVLWTLKLAQ